MIITAFTLGVSNGVGGIQVVAVTAASGGVLAGGAVAEGGGLAAGGGVATDGGAVAGGGAPTSSFLSRQLQSDLLGRQHILSRCPGIPHLKHFFSSKFFRRSFPYKIVF